MVVFCVASGGVASLNRPANGFDAFGIGGVIRSLTDSELYGEMGFEEGARVFWIGEGGLEELVVGLMDAVLWHVKEFGFRSVRGCLLLRRIGGRRGVVASALRLIMENAHLI